MLQDLSFVISGHLVATPGKRWRNGSKPKGFLMFFIYVLMLSDEDLMVFNVFKWFFDVLKWFLSGLLGFA